MSGRPTALERGGLEVRSRHDHLAVESGEVVIVSAGATAAPTEVRISVDEVRGATVVPARRGTPGWLHVAVVDGSPPPPGQLAAVGDPYTIALGKRSGSAARRFARAVEEHVLRHGLPRSPATAVRSTSVVLTDERPPLALVAVEGDAIVHPGPPTPRMSDAGDDPDWVARLAEVADLHERGLLTEHELAAAKARLLAERA